MTLPGPPFMRYGALRMISYLTSCDCSKPSFNKFVVNVWDRFSACLCAKCQQKRYDWNCVCGDATLTILSRSDEVSIQH
eukprot:944481-Amphidinium_carterae.1